MGRKALYTSEQVKAIHCEMVANNWTVPQAAESNTILKFAKWPTLYAALRKEKLETNVKKITKQVVQQEAVTV
jgi:hypothetical protein